MKEKGRDLDLKKMITVNHVNTGRKRRKLTGIEIGTRPIETSIETRPSTEKGEISTKVMMTEIFIGIGTAQTRSTRAADGSDRVQPTVRVAIAAGKAYWSQRVSQEKR